MKRRNFLATLFAPLVARFSPKPKPAGEVIFSFPSTMECAKFVDDGINPEWDGSVRCAQESIYRGFADYVGTPNPMFSHLISKNVGTFEGGEQMAEIFIYPKESV